MNSFATHEQPKFTRQINGWTPNEVPDARYNYDDLIREEGSTFAMLVADPAMEYYDVALERQHLENGIKLEDLESTDERNSFYDKPEEDQFNDFYNTTYTKKEIDRIYLIADLYAVKTKDAITYDSNCHTCGDALTKDANNVYCSQECYESYDLKNSCFWGKDCKMCHGYQVMDAINCCLCATHMASYDGYTLSNMTTVCIKCYNMSSDCDIYSDEEIECLDEADEAAIEYLDDNEGQSDPLFILPSREPYNSQRYYEDMKSRLECCYPDKKDDPEFKKKIDMFTYNIRQCEEDRKIQIEHCQLDRAKRHDIFFKSYDEDMDYHLWLKEQKELYKDDPEFQKNLAMFTYNNNPDQNEHFEDDVVLNIWPEDDDWNMPLSRPESFHPSLIEKPELKSNNEYYISSDEDEIFSPLRRTDSIRLDDEVLSLLSAQNASGIEESMVDTLNRLYDHQDELIKNRANQALYRNSFRIGNNNNV